MKPGDTARKARGAAARVSGRRGELLVLVMLMLKGYRILGFRLKTPQAEIDILALRRRTLVAVEVKRRTHIAAALEAVTHDQRVRLRRAAANLAAGRPSLRGAAVRLDLVALAPKQLPVHIPDAWKGT